MKITDLGTLQRLKVELEKMKDEFMSLIKLEEKEVRGEYDIYAQIEDVVENIESIEEEVQG